MFRFLIAVLFFYLSNLASIQGRKGFGPGQQDWGFFNVRGSGHMFYWLYYTTAEDVVNYTDKPLVIWLQGGPGASSTGSGNFENFGPWDVHGNYRNTTFVKHVNLLFIDSPLGAGYSYVQNDEDYATSTNQIARDLVEFMKQFYRKHAEFIASPLHIFSESCGGKMAPEFALELYKATVNGEIFSNLKSVTVGNPYTSPIDTTLAIAPYMLQMGLIDYSGYNELSALAYKFVDSINTKNYSLALEIQILTFHLIRNLTDNGYIYNVQKPGIINNENYYAYNPALRDLMREPVREALNISTEYLWAEFQINVFHNLFEDFFQSSVHIVQELLNTTPIKVAFYSGQLDLRCATVGTLNWINKMDWDDKKSYVAAKRSSFKINNIVEGYEKSDGKLSMYWINRAGHMVQMDNPTAMKYILDKVINSESEST